MTNGATSRGGPRIFPVTQWTVVLKAGATPSPESAAALARLCAAYWYPLYVYVRRSGYAPADAEDLTQEFFARLLEHQWVARVDPDKGRFRSFLLMVMKRFLVKEWDKAKAVKRGGQVQCISLSFDTAETRYIQEPADTRTPEQVFEKQWSLTLLASVLGKLRASYEQDGKGELFCVLEPCLVGARENQPYAELGARLGLAEGAVRTAVFRLRQRYREFLEAEIAQTVASPEEVGEELRHLFRVMARS